MRTTDRAILLGLMLAGLLAAFWFFQRLAASLPGFR
jgi:hypothetical protein